MLGSGLTCNRASFSTGGGGVQILLGCKNFNVTVLFVYRVECFGKALLTNCCVGHILTHISHIMRELPFPKSHQCTPINVHY